MDPSAQPTPAHANAASPTAAATAASVGKTRKPPTSTLSSAGKTWRPMSKSEVASKRTHQSAVSQNVVLLTACLSDLAQMGAQAPPTKDAESQSQHAGMQLTHAEVHPALVEAQSAHAEKIPDVRGGVSGKVEWGDVGDSVLPVIGVLSNPQELKLHVMTACQLVDRGVGSRIAIAANQGVICPPPLPL